MIGLAATIIFILAVCLIFTSYLFVKREYEILLLKDIRTAATNWVMLYEPVYTSPDTALRDALSRYKEWKEKANDKT